MEHPPPELPAFPGSKPELGRHPEIRYNTRSLDEYARLPRRCSIITSSSTRALPRGLKGEEIPLYARIIAGTNLTAPTPPLNGCPISSRCKPEEAEGAVLIRIL